MSTAPSDSSPIFEWCRHVFGASHDPYALLDAEGRYLWFNEAGTALFGYTPEEVVGTHFRDHLIQGEPDGDVFIRALHGIGGDVVRHIRRKDGTVAPVQAELLPAADGMVLVHATDLREIFSDIRQLRSNTVLQALLSSSPDGIWLMDASLRLAQVNQRAADLLRSVNGKEPVIGSTLGEGNTPEPVRDLVRQLGTAAAAGRHSESVQRLTDLHGLPRFLQFNVFPLTASGGGPVLGVAFAVRDITEQIEAEQLAHQRLDLLTRAESIANVGTWVYHLPSGRQEWTDGVYRLLNLPVDGGPDIDAYLARIHPDDRARVRETLLRRRSDATLSVPAPFRLLLPSGDIRWLEEFISVVRDEHGNISSFAGTLQDITERVIADEQARQVERMDAITRVVGGVAHDLNNYLSAILGPIDLVRAGDDRVDFWLSMADGSARRAAAVVRQLVQLVRPTPLRFDRFSLVETVMAAIASADVSPSPTVTSAAERIEMTGDSEQLTQVLVSLLKNAGEAVAARADTAAPGYVPAIGVEISASAEWVAIAVRDNGVGMDEEARRRALDPYFTTKQSGHAVGLSLAIAHRIVTEHRGRLLFESEPGVGTTVRVSLPRTPLSGAGDTPSATSSDHGPARILVVDDEVAVRALEIAVLEDAGHSAIAVASGDAAIEACRTQEFDLVLLNVNMPGRNGLDTLTVLQSEHPTLRVAMVSGSDIEQQVAGRHVAGVVRKPWTGTELVQAVASFL